MKNKLSNFNNSNDYEPIEMTDFEKKKYLNSFKNKNCKPRAVAKKRMNRAVIAVAALTLGVSVASAASGGFTQMVKNVTGIFKSEKKENIENYFVGIDMQGVGNPDSMIATPDVATPSEAVPEKGISGGATIIHDELVEGDSFNVIFEQAYIDGTGMGMMIVSFEDKNGNAFIANENAHIVNENYYIANENDYIANENTFIEAGYIDGGRNVFASTESHFDENNRLFISFTANKASCCEGLYIKIGNEYFDAYNVDKIQSGCIEWSDENGSIYMGNFGMAMQKGTKLHKVIDNKMYEEGKDCFITIKYSDGTVFDAYVNGYGGYGNFFDSYKDGIYDENKQYVEINIGINYKDYLAEMMENNDFSLLDKKLYVDLSKLESISCEGITLYAKDAIVRGDV